MWKVIFAGVVALALVGSTFVQAHQRRVPRSLHAVPWSCSGAHASACNVPREL